MHQTFFLCFDIICHFQMLPLATFHKQAIEMDREIITVMFYVPIPNRNLTISIQNQPAISDYALVTSLAARMPDLSALSINPLSMVVCSPAK